MFTVTFYHCVHLASSKIRKFKRLASYFVIVAGKIGHETTLSSQQAQIRDDFRSYYSSHRWNTSL